MKQKIPPLPQQISIVTALIICFFYHSGSQAQIVPDNTLINNSRIETQNNRSVIEGGTRAGNNLFHSFQEFSIPTGHEAFFNNAADLVNILNRVTGDSISNINGLIRANGSANLFFLNPNGIILGKNASLDIGGSFIATTANSINFADGTSFVVRGSENQRPILSWNAPIGLGLNSQSGSILIEGSGHNFSANDPIFSPLIRLGNFNGLTVKPGKSLGLLGNNITLQGGNLSAPQGKIQLGSVREGIVGLNFEDFSLDLQTIQGFSDILLTSESSIDVSGLTGGSIQIQGRNITIDDGSVVLVQNQGLSSANGISLQASNDIEVSGTNQNGLVRSYVLSEAFAGNTGDIKISAQNLKVDQGAAIAIRAFKTANAEQLILNITDSIQVSDFNPIIPVASSTISIANLGNGQGGNLDIFTQNLLVDSGGGIGTITFGIQGNSGSLAINAKNITIEEVNPINTLPSNLFSSTVSEGQGGKITIKTSLLNILEGGQISTGTGASGNAGDIFIEADQLNLISNPNIRLIAGDVRTSRIIAIAAPPTPAQQKIVGSSSEVTGASGNITINTENLNIQRARITVSNQGQGAIGNINIQTDSLTNIDGIISASGLSELSGSDFSGGNININADFLTFNDGSIAANTPLFGSGGNITINADLIELNNNSNIFAFAGGEGNGGNITLSTDQLQLQNNSNISASAGGEGNGGNIDITADTIVALNDSDITATAFKGNGGNITITADGILGIEERKATPDNGTSDIDASSEFGEDGTVVITNPQTVIQDPIIAVREIDSTDPRDKSNNDCWNGNFDRRKRRLVYVGRGGFSPEPEDFNDGTDHYITAPGFVAPEPEPEDWDIPAWQEGDPLIEANAVRVDSNGEVYLVAELESEKAKSLVCDVQETEETEEEKATVTNRQSN